MSNKSETLELFLSLKDKLSEGVKKASGNIKKLQDEHKGLQESLANNKASIKQITSLKKLQDKAKKQAQSFNNLGKKLADHKAKMATAKVVTDKMRDQQIKLSQKLRDSKDKFSQQTNAVKEAQQALTKRGVNVKKLISEEKRLGKAVDATKGKIEASTRTLAKSMARRAKIKNLAKGGVGAVKKGVGFAKTAAFTAMAGAGTIGAAGAGLAYFIKTQSDQLEQVRKLKKTTGLSAKEIQAFDYAMKLTGGSIDEGRDALIEFNLRMGQAGTLKEGPLYDYLEATDKKLLKKIQTSKSSAQAILHLADAVAAKKTAQERNLMLDEMVGGQLTGVVNLFSQGSKGLKTHFAEFSKFGGGATDEDIKNSERLGKAITRLLAVFDAVKFRFLGPLIEKIATSAENFIASITDEKIAQWMKQAKEAGKELVEVIQQLYRMAKSLANFFSDDPKSLKNTSTSEFDYLEKSLGLDKKQSLADKVLATQSSNSKQETITETTNNKESLVRLIVESQEGTNAKIKESKTDGNLLVDLVGLNPALAY